MCVPHQALDSDILGGTDNIKTRTAAAMFKSYLQDATELGRSVWTSFNYYYMAAGFSCVLLAVLLSAPPLALAALTGPKVVAFSLILFHAVLAPQSNSYIEAEKSLLQVRNRAKWALWRNVYERARSEWAAQNALFVGEENHTGGSEGLVRAERLAQHDRAKQLVPAQKAQFALNDRLVFIASHRSFCSLCSLLVTLASRAERPAQFHSLRTALSSRFAPYSSRSLRSLTPAQISIAAITLTLLPVVASQDRYWLITIPVVSRVHELFVSGHGVDVSLGAHLAQHPAVWVWTIAIYGHLVWFFSPSKGWVFLVNMGAMAALAVTFVQVRAHTCHGRLCEQRGGGASKGPAA